MAVAVWTVNLYGILVTEESFLKGARTHVRAQFQRNIIRKIVPGNLPTELVDQILQDSDDQARQIVDDVWRECATADEVASKFTFWPGSVGAELLDITSLGIDAYPIAKHTAANTANLVDGEDRKTKYVVLSTSALHPDPLELVERPLAPSAHFPNSRIYAGDRGVTIAWQGRNSTAPHVTVDNLSFYHGDDIDSSSINNGEGTVQADRILQLRGVKEAIRNWEAEKMKKFVEELRLEVMPLNPADPMEPEIIQAQRVHAR
ncbi:hypothetical protein CBER1_08286 [Cercospora berteroae]|uniref:Uncharacterized protein n=1 Tax=Cercospora berteroae TaxID=357750 RepID=A0A2S6C7L5_9PEZI|nr:hypothetical protein CBER1_08286 [Cercospora berteroae]